MERRIIPEIIDGRQTLTCLPPDATVAEAVGLMVANRVGAVLLVEDERLVGIFTERDVVRRVVHPGRIPAETPLHAVMTAEPDVLHATDSAAQALRLMTERGYRHLPVTDEEARPVGMVSVRDLFAAVQAELQEDLQHRDALIFDVGYGVSH